MNRVYLTFLLGTFTWTLSLGSEAKLPEGCVKSLEETQEPFADRRHANKIYVDDLKIMADLWKDWMECLIGGPSFITKEQAVEAVLLHWDCTHMVKDENGSWRKIKLAPSAQISNEGEPEIADAEIPF